MIRLLFSYLFILGALTASQAQVAADALRYSFLQVGGTARTVAIGGGIGALGADFSVISTNPAGLAAFRKSEFTMTPSLFLTNTDAQLESGDSNPTVSDNKTSFNFNNLGLVFARPTRSQVWSTSNIAIGLNRLANFHQRIHYNGTSRGSYIDDFQEEAGDLPVNDLNDFDTGLAFDVEALYQAPDEGSDFWETDVELNENALISKDQTITRTGAVNELAFAWAGNIKERVMIGLTLGLPILSYKEKNIYQETDEVDEVSGFESIRYEENLTTTGVGLNLKLGMILRLSQMLRIGGAIHTPTTYTLTDDYDTYLFHSFNDNGVAGSLESASPESTFEYDLKTPWRFIGSAGILIKRSGFISAEVEYVNYGGANFDLTKNDNSTSTADFQRDLNEEIASIYQSAVNFRLGGEFAHKIFRLRAGVNISGTPYAANNIKNNAYSLGLGIRKDQFFVDFAYKYAKSKDTFEPYTVSDIYPQNSVSTNTIRNSLLLTFGFKF